MADVHTKEHVVLITCSAFCGMSRIKGRDTKPEILVRHFLHANGFRYKLHDKTLPGKPGIVLPKYKTVMIIHACLPVGRAVFGMGIKTVNIVLYLKPESEKLCFKKY